MDNEAAERIAGSGVSGRPEAAAPADRGLRTMMTWVFGALLLTVLFGILVVELTLRWFR